MFRELWEVIALIFAAQSSPQHYTSVPPPTACNRKTYWSNLSPHYCMNESLNTSNSLCPSCWQYRDPYNLSPATTSDVDSTR